MPLTQAELNEIKERAEKATSCPWQVASTTDGEYIIDCDEWVVAATFERKEDAYFVAHAREDIPRLVAEVERLRDVISRCECAFCSDELGDDWRLVSGLVVCEECEGIYGGDNE
ncbi:hypothetical protein [Aeribacillus sp. FSL M8-0254]|uniref:hypothetical protein n=1 Tax=Aeribacillus sp. FSL M8-0254 TaxID=2954577 RepID=UPI0030FBA8BD